MGILTLATAKDIFQIKGTGNVRHSIFDLSPSLQEVKARLDKSIYGFNAYHLLTLIANTGLRSSEAIDLNVEDFNQMEVSNSIRVRRKKKNRGRADKTQIYQDSMAVSSHEKKLFQKILRDRNVDSGRLFPFTKRMAGYLFSHFARQSGIRDSLSLHSLRRFCAQRMYAHLDKSSSNAHGSIMVKFRLGHSLTTTEKYIAGMFTSDYIQEILVDYPAIQ